MTTASNYRQPAAWYDRIHAVIGKDYAAEAARVADLARAHSPHARTLLDIGCGTGMHLRHLRREFSEAIGIDLDPDFVELATVRGLDVQVGDMRAFDLGRTFDVITCLNASIGHLTDADELAIAIGVMADHLAHGGVIVLDPWRTPDRDGHLGVAVSDAPDSILTRANHVHVDGEQSTVTFAWLHATPAGIERLDEVLTLRAFSEDDLHRAFARVDLTVDQDPATGWYVAS